MLNPTTLKATTQAERYTAVETTVAKGVTVTVGLVNNCTARVRIDGANMGDVATLAYLIAAQLASLVAAVPRCTERLHRYAMPTVGFGSAAPEHRSTALITLECVGEVTAAEAHTITNTARSVVLG